MGGLDKQLNIGGNMDLAPSEVEASICLSSDLQFPTSTSLGGKQSDLKKTLDISLDYLAGVLVDAFWENKINYAKTNKTNNNIL